MCVEVGKLTITLGVNRIPKVLLAQRYNNFINQWFAEPRDLHKWSGLCELTITLNNCCLPPACRGIDTDDRAGIIRIRGIRAITRQEFLGYLESDRVYVVPFSSIHTWLSRSGNEMQILERSKSGKIENRAKVHVETLCALPGENSSTTREIVYC